MLNPRTHASDAFYATDPSSAVNHALQIIEKGELPTFFLETDGPIAPEIRDLLENIRGMHGNIGSKASDGFGVHWETREVTPTRKIDGKKQIPRGQQAIEQNRTKIEEIIKKVLQAGGRVVVEKTDKKQQAWLDKVIEIK